MKKIPMSSWLANMFGGKKPSKRRKIDASTKIVPQRPEQLETRIVPAVVTWDGGGTTQDWNDADNWDTDTAPTNGDDVVFATAEGITNQNIAALTLQSLTFQVGGNTVNLVENTSIDGTGAGDLTNTLGTNSITGGTLTITNTTLDVSAASGSLSIGSVIASAAGEGLTLNNGTLTLTGANTYSGNTTVQDGTLNLNSGSNSAIGTGNLTIGDATGVAGSALVNLQAADQIGDTADVTILSDGLLASDFADTVGDMDVVAGGQISGTGTVSTASLELFAASSDTVAITATGTNAGTAQVGSGTAFNIATDELIVTGSGDNTLTINNPVGGLFAPTNGITFTGGTNSTLNNLGGGNGTGAGVSTPTNLNDGTLTHTQGATVQTIDYTGLAPITDTVSEATFEIAGTAAVDTVTVSNGLPGQITVDSDTFELINFANKVAVTLNLGADADVVTVDATVAAIGMTSLTVNGEAGADTINVEQTIIGVTTAVNGGTEDDIVNVGDTGSLDGILGGLTVDGGAGSNNLNLDDSAETAGNTYAIGATSVTRGTQVINFSNTSLAIDAGSGADVFTVTNLTMSGAGLDLDGNAGTDSAILDNVDISGATGNGLTLDAIEDVTIQNGSTFNTNGADGIHITGAVTVSVTGSNANDNTTDGIFVDGGTTTTTVTLDTFGATGNGDDGADIGAVSGLTTLTGVALDQNTGRGAELSDLGDLLVTGGTFFDNDNDGIQIDSANLVTITNASVTSNGEQGLDGNAAIVGNVSITGGSFSDNDEEGIRFDGAGTVDLDNVTVNDNGNDGLELDNTGAVTITNNSTFNGNDEDGIDLATVGAITISDTDANGNDPGILVNGAPSFSLTNSSASTNDNGGIYLDNITGDVTLTGVDANDNDADQDGTGAGLSVQNIGGNIVILGGSFSDTGGAGEDQERGIVVRTSPTARVFIGNDGVTVNAVIANGNQDDGLSIRDVEVVSLDSVTANNNLDYGIDIRNVTATGAAEGILNMTDLTLTGNTTNGGNLDNIEQVVYTTNKSTLPAVADTLVLTANTIQRTTPAQQAIEYANILEMAILTGAGDDTIDVQGTGATVETVVYGGSGNDTITIAGSNLTGRNGFFGDGFEDGVVVATTGPIEDLFDAAAVVDPGNDQFNLNITTDVTATELKIDGNGNGTVPGGATANRDRLTITDNNSVTRDLSFNYLSQTAGDIDIVGFAATTDVEGRNLETVISQKPTGTNNTEVHGTGLSSEDITVAPINDTDAMVFIGTDAAGGGWNGPPADFFTTLPGIAGGSFGPDLRINAINAAGLQVFNDTNGNTTNHQVYVDSSSEAGVSDGTGIDQFGLGAGVLVPAFGLGNAFDDIDVDSTAGVSTVSITNTANGPLVNVVLPQATDFTQYAPPVGEVNRPGLIVNAGFEAGLRAGSLVADDITADTSLQFYTKINGGDPTLNIDPVTGAPTGDQLNFTSIGDINVYSDGAVIPNVTVTDSVVANTGISFSSIERSVNKPGSGTVNIIGDNNDGAITQNDVFVVRGEVIPTMAQQTPDSGFQAFSLQIGGNKDTATGTVDLSDRIYFIGVTRINANGGAAGETVDTGIDTLNITPYADNTPQGWGIETFWNEGDPVLDGDLLVFNGVNGVSDDITIAPSSPEAGQVFSINAATGTPIAVVNYVLNGAIIVNGNDGSLGDTDKLTLRGTDGVSPNTSGNDGFEVNYDADGTAASPFITVTDLVGGALLYNLQDVTNLDVIHIDALAGLDVVNITDTGIGAGGFQNTNLNIEMGDGADLVEASGSTTGRGYVISGGAGIDIIIGGDGADIIDGGDGDDFLSGNGGFNLINGGLNNDIIFVDEAGVGSTTLIDGGDGVDSVLFTGSAGVDAYSLGLGILPDSVGVVTPNNLVNAAGIENIEIDTGDDADTVDVGDLFGTSLTKLTVDVDGGDADVVTVEGRNNNDNINLSEDGGDVTIAGLIYEIIIAAATPAAGVVINANDGDDVVKANPGVEDVIGITLNGGDGDDNLSADAVINGGAGDDILQGGAGNDTINGNDGDDIIYFAAGGTDDIDGGAGFDQFVVESGNGNTTMSVSETAVTVDGGTETLNTFAGMELVRVIATAGNDNITVGLTSVAGVILGGYGNDTIDGTTSTVPLIIAGGLGNDTLTGGSAADQIEGEEGDDTITGGDGADTLNGGVGNDTIVGGLGDDTIDGGDGFDTLTGGVGDDTLIGGGDGDNFILATGDGEDYIEGGSGADWVTFNSTGGALDVGIAGNGINITTATNDAGIYGVEELDIDGTAAANQITIGDLSGSGLEYLDVELSGAADTVTVNGQNAADNITVSSPSAGNVEVDGLAFEMLIEATAAADTLTVNGNEGNDTIKANEGVEAQIGIVLNGNAGDDFLSADATLNGGTGNDTLQGGNGDDTINGNEGDDTIIFTPGGTDTIDGGTGFDRILVTGSGANNVISVTQTAITVDGQTENLVLSNIDLIDVNSLAGNDNVTVTLATIAGHVDAGDGNDVVIGTASAAALHIDGGDGNDDITGGAGNDTVDAGAGNDLVRGGLGDDQLNGGDGADVFFWSIGDGSDTVTGGGDGADRLEFTGGAAADAITLAATPGHATVTLGAATVDTTGVENLQINALAGGDTVTVGDLSTSNVTSVAVDLGAGDTDALVVNGRTTADVLAVTAPSATTLKIQGLAYDLNASNVALPDTLTVNGNQGDDEIKASSGVETTVNIIFNGGEGNDFLSADATLNGDAGDDVLVGGVGADSLNGGDGDDLLTGNGGIDAFDGGAGYDTVVENRDANFTLTNTTLIIGAEGTDTLASIENAHLTGGLSANLFVIGAFTGDTSIKGNGGSDTADFSTTTQGIHIDLDAKGVDQIINLAGRKIVFDDIIENLNASPFNDTIEVDIAQFNRNIDGGLEDSIPPGDRLNVDLLGSNPTSTKVPNGGKLGSFNGTVNGSGFTGTISYEDIETLVIKGANSAPPNFSSATQYDMGDGPRGVITADFDGDGILDMATANSKSNDISVRLGDGFGSFGAVVHYSAGGKKAKQTTTIAAADVDGDGDIDLVVTNRKTNNVSVLLGNGDGTFGAATLYSTGDKKTGKFPTGVKLGDMDGDGNLDIVTANSNVGKNGSFSILLGDGAGGFGTANVTATKGRRPRDLVLIDVDGDTNLDVVATNLLSKSVFVLAGDGAGGLGAPTSYDVAITPNSIISGDFNGDGILDVVTTSLVSPRLSILLGNGSGFDPVKEIKYPATKLDISINTADIDGDGNLDLLIANRNDNTLSYMLGNGNGSFDNRVDFKTGNTIFREPVAIAVGDFNNDGAIDLIVANGGSDDVSVLIHDAIV